MLSPLTPMAPAGPGDVTRLLSAWSRGDRAALDELLPIVYGELHRLASRARQGERPGHMLQTTALVHEAYLRLVGQRRVQLTDRAHFFSVAARMMRRILVDHARRRHAGKRGGGEEVLRLEEGDGAATHHDFDVVALDEALTQLADLDARQGRIVELRFFGGLSVHETADVVGVSPATIKREWQAARAWLYREIASGPRHAG